MSRRLERGNVFFHQTPKLALECPLLGLGADCIAKSLNRSLLTGLRPEIFVDSDFCQSQSIDVAVPRQVAQHLHQLPKLHHAPASLSKPPAFGAPRVLASSYTNR